MRRVHGFRVDLVHLVQNVEKVSFGIHADPFDAGHDFADDFLPRPGIRAIFETLQIRQKVGVHEPKERTQGTILKFIAFWPARRGPILPAIGMLQRGLERDAQRFGFTLFAFLALIENAQKQNPGQFGHILQSPGTVPPPHDVANGLDRLVHRLLRGQFLAVAVLAFSGHLQSFA